MVNYYYGQKFLLSFGNGMYNLIIKCTGVHHFFCLSLLLLPYFYFFYLMSHHSSLPMVFLCTALRLPVRLVRSRSFFAWVPNPDCLSSVYSRIGFVCSPSLISSPITLLTLRKNYFITRACILHFIPLDSTRDWHTYVSTSPQLHLSY